MGTEDARELATRLGYQFSDPALLETALTHRSAGQPHNERLEFLGDAVLGFAIAERLYLRFPDAAEGTLTRLRASLVKRETLAAIARGLRLGDHIHLGSGERKSGGWRRESILSNTLESIFGAIYLDAGADAARRVILGLYSDLIEDLPADAALKDPKTELQEWLQAGGRSLPLYRVVAEEGAAHARTFRVECVLEDPELAVEAQGRSKRTAEQAAARMVLDRLQIDQR